MLNAFTVTPLNTFKQHFVQMTEALLDTDLTQVGEWQSQKIDAPMHELLHVVVDMPIPQTAEEAGEMTGARLPWAEDHFLERVGGEPLNPSPSEQWWPFRKKSADGDTNKEHKSEGEAFSHTYPERMWPKFANDRNYWDSIKPGDRVEATPHWGIRFAYGDLQDVVNQLVQSPMTRQAYLPIWFPEDTGAVHGKRVPCTLGYHFIIRDGKLDISYFMRSTDLLRHYQDDIYMAMRLAQWMVEKINDGMSWKYNEPIPPGEELEVGQLVFHTANLHIFEGDEALIQFWKSQDRVWF
jgi:hypothetical protein